MPPDLLAGTRLRDGPEPRGVEVGGLRQAAALQLQAQQREEKQQVPERLSLRLQAVGDAESAVAGPVHPCLCHLYTRESSMPDMGQGLIQAVQCRGACLSVCTQAAS